MRSLWRRFVGIWDNDAYRSYLRRRGFHAESGWPFVRRGFLECWARPGFHLFWQLWNPALGFLTFLLYRKLGRGPASKVVVFLFSGIAHNALVFPFLGWSLVVPVTFACFGLLVALWPAVSRVLLQARWPAALNVVLNAALVAGSFDVGYRVHAAIAGGGA